MYQKSFNYLNIIIFVCALLLPSAIVAAGKVNNLVVCANCHQHEYQEWEASHHALAMQIANQQNVLGNFNNVTFKYANVTTRFYKKGKDFYIYTQGEDGKYAVFKVAYTFGVEPLQQYLVTFPDGRLQAFTIAWDTQQKKWFALQSAEDMQANAMLHWTKRFYNWNHFCADCHSTELKKSYQEKQGTYHTSWSAMNVSCQACHGKGHRRVKSLAPAPLPQVGEGKKHFSKEIVDTCAACHARRHPITPDVTTGTSLLNNYVPETIRPGIYYADGSLQEEDYEYGSFIQSKMYKAGVVCTDCHNPHSLQLKVPGNGVCLQCHNTQPPAKRFPMLKAKNYNTPAHHFHKSDSAGAQCINCHMPPKTYMKVDVRRDHYFRVPRPDLTIKYNIPNACNTCHQDKSPQWSVEHMQKWYGKKDYSQKIKVNGAAQEVVDIFALAYQGAAQAEAGLIAVSQDLQQATMVRASAIELLPRYSTSASWQACVVATQDAQPLVRMMAARGLLQAPAEMRSTALTPLLSDPIRAVRIEAAHALVDVSLPAAQQVIFNKALLEYKAAQQAQIDQPEGNANLGDLAFAQGNKSTAINYYQTAIKMDKNFYPASEKLAIIYNLMGANDKAMAALQAAIAHNPEQGRLYYSLGLLFAEQEKYVESAAMLAQAVRLLPDNARVRYNYDLVRQQL